MRGSRNCGIPRRAGGLVAQRPRHNRWRHAVIQDAGAGFAMNQLFGARAAELLKNVGANAHAAGSANFAANFGHRDATVLLGDTLVVIEEVFGNHSDYAGAFGFLHRQSTETNGLLGVDSSALSAAGFLGFLHEFLGSFDAPVVLFGGDHLFEQAIFGVRNFVLGVLHFMLERLESFVGLHLVGLVLISFGFFFPALDVQLIFLARLESFELSGFAG